MTDYSSNLDNKTEFNEQYVIHKHSDLQDTDVAIDIPRGTIKSGEIKDANTFYSDLYYDIKLESKPEFVQKSNIGSHNDIHESKITDIDTGMKEKSDDMKAGYDIDMSLHHEHSNTTFMPLGEQIEKTLDMSSSSFKFFSSVTFILVLS